MRSPTAPNRPPAEAPAPAASPSPDDVDVAARSALTLGTSLVVTWSVGLLVRFFLPRYLGPEHFGTLNFADNFAGAFIVFLGLGVETYIQKEIPVRPAHASDFFGGLIVLRLALGALLFGAMTAVMMVAHRPPAVQRIVFVFAFTDFLWVLNNNLAALLHASRKVGELAVINVASKVLWSAGIGLSLLGHLGLGGIVATFLIAEAARTVSLFPLARRYLGLRMSWSSEAVKAVAVASLPFYVNQVAISIYAKVGVSLLSILSNDTEVGWYSSAFNLAGLALLIAPLVSSVLTPLFSRAAARSQAELFVIMSGSIRTILMLVLPVSLLLGLGAEVWIRILFGASYAPAALSLRILAPMFVITYVAMVAGPVLILLRRAWTLTLVSLAGIAGSVVLNAALVPLGKRWLGPGGAGAGAATTVILTELGVAAALVAAIGARAFDRASVSSIARAVSCCLLVIGADVLLRPLGAARLAIDAAAYVALLFALGAARPGEVKQAVRFLLRRHRHATS